MFRKSYSPGRKIISFMASLLVLPVLLAACSSISDNQRNTENNQEHEGYIKFYEWQDKLPKNLIGVLEDDRKILEIKAPDGQKHVRFSLDLLKDGKMQTAASFEMTLDDKELNYTALSFDNSETHNHIAVTLNGNKETITFPKYFQDTTERKLSILGNKRDLQSVNYLMYIVDSGEVIDLNKIYNGDISIKGTNLLVLKMELLPTLI